MAVASPEKFESSIKSRGPLKVYMNGQPINDLWDHPVTRTVLEANKASYEWAGTPEGEPILTAHSHLIDEKVHRYTHICGSIDDLEAKAAAGTWVAERLGTCIYRCVGLDASHSLAATTWEMDQKEGTDYHPRFIDYWKQVQKEDLSVAGALTEPRGDRKQRAAEWKDPFLSLKLVEKRPDGIVVRGAKINISGAYGGHEVIVLPQSAKRPGEEDYALAFAVPANAEGVTYICQYNALSAEREQCDSPDELGNPRFGQRETSMIIFDNVFVPSERVFLCGEVPYAGRMVARFAQTHRMTCGGTCKVGFMNQIIGAAKLLQEMKGMEKVPHINDQIIEMITLRETVRACGLAAAFKGQEIPPGSGVFMPNDMYGNISKINVAPAFWRIMALAGDIAGGLPVTMPSIRELSNPDTAGFVKDFLGFGSEHSAEKIMKVTKLIQNWTAGLHGVGTWHGAGPVAAQKIMVTRLADFEHDKQIVRRTLNLEEK